jgi:hypothetical protein
VFVDAENCSFFQTEEVSMQLAQADFTAVGVVGATVHPSNSGASRNIILFENPDLASSYTDLIQHQINIQQIQNVTIRQKQTELERTKDLLKNGSATGQELLEAELGLSIEETNLATEQAALMEHETTLRAAGFDAEILKRTNAGTAFIVSDIPENLIGNVKKNSSCALVFTAFSHEEFSGKIRALADRVDPTTRMVKILIEMNNPQNKLKSGMFANTTFTLVEGDFITISKNALVTVQGKHYVFRKKAEKRIERTEVQPGPQIGDRIVVYDGLSLGDTVVVKGVMQLKGLSFGY